jgi:hypothetical protein
MKAVVEMSPVQLTVIKSLTPVTGRGPGRILSQRSLAAAVDLAAERNLQPP